MSNVDYGPLQALIGEWRGDKGVDIAPEPEGTETNHYYERLIVTPINNETATNAEEQHLAVLYYRQIVQRISTDKIIHDQTGYWMWDENSQQVMQSLTIPRGVCVLAGSEAISRDAKSITVKASVSDDAFTIVQSPFMQQKAKTIDYTHTVNVEGNKLAYSQTMLLDVYGRQFEHTDENVLLKTK